MTLKTTEKIRLDILVDKPLLTVVTEILHESKAGGHTVLRALGGEGLGGSWQEDQISSTDEKVMVICVLDADTADRVMDKLQPLLDPYGIVVLVSRTGVVRGNKFR